ncbi:26301_t:CDS:2, partial [Racocetra persica]
MNLSDQSQSDLEEYKGLLNYHVENPDSLAAFKYFNPKITLSTCKLLSKKILSKAVSEFIPKIEVTAQKDKVEITKAQDVNAEQSRASDIILKIEELFKKFNPELENLLWVDLELFRQKQSPFNAITSRQFSNDVIGYWSHYASCAKELEQVVLQIYEICVDAASVECLWSSIGFIYSNRRNKLL